MSWFDFRRARLWVVAMAVVLVSGLVLAGSVRAAQLVNATPDGVAMDGYDPVNYFTENTAARGNPDIRAEWNGVTYWFTTTSHRDAFLADPAKYAPQYNGWCAVAVSEGYAAEVDVIDGWFIDDDKLYVNWDRKTRDEMLAALQSRLAKGRKNWPTVEAGIKDGSGEIARHAAYPEENPDNIAHPQ